MLRQQQQGYWMRHFGQAYFIDPRIIATMLFRPNRQLRNCTPKWRPLMVG